MLYLGRALISTLVMAFFSVIYVKTRERVQQQATLPLPLPLTLTPTLTLTLTRWPTP